LRIHAADGASSPVEVMPPPSARKYWTRRGIAERLVERPAEDAATLVGILVCSSPKKFANTLMPSNL
jgi:hypothetical protein